MAHVLLLLAALCPLCPAAPGAAPAPAGHSASSPMTLGELRELVADEAARAEQRSVGELWNRALLLRDSARLGEDGELDRVLDNFLRGSDLSRKATLLLAAARLLGDAPENILLVEALSPLTEASDDVAIGAITLLANPVFRTLQTRRRDSLVDSMLEAARDTGRSPEYRLSFAESAYRIGGGSERRQALKQMRLFFNSSDAELEAKGALALAATGSAVIEGRLRRVLEDLERFPDPRGRLAAAYLRQARQSELYERRFRDARERASSSLPEDLDVLNRVMDMVSSMHLEGNRYSREQLVSAAMNGMLHWLDPHSSYMSSETYARFFQELEAEYGGIGAYVGEDPDNKLFTIVRPIYSGPAYEAGLKSDDKIVRIGDWPTLGQNVDDVIKRLKGKPGTPVKLYVWRRGLDPELIERPSEDMAVVIDRAQIEIPAGASQMLPGKIGLVELSTFSKKAMSDVRQDLAELLDDGMRALVLDLRNNSGGLLNEARDVADLFLPSGRLVVTTEERQGQPERHVTREAALVPASVPVVVLTNRYTASAAEIVAGALQDHERASLVGKRTFGKGSVQQLLPVDGMPQDDWDDGNRNGVWDPWEEITTDHDGDAEVDYSPRVKLTIARYLLPSGRSIHRQLDREGVLIQEGGVEPNHVSNARTEELWRIREMRSLINGGKLKDYVDQHWQEHRERFVALAVNDGKDPDAYPGFNAFMAGLATVLSRDNVRRLLRSELRRRVEDERGAQFPSGDFVEDLQLQKGLELLLAELGETHADVSEFGLVFDLEALEDGGDPRRRVAMLRPYQDDLRRVRALILEAREDGTRLSPDQLEELAELLEEIESN